MDLKGQFEPLFVEWRKGGRHQLVRLWPPNSGGGGGLLTSIRYTAILLITDTNMAIDSALARRQCGRADCCGRAGWLVG